MCKSYYSHLNVGERIEVSSSLENGAFEGFIESIRIEGHYQNDVWRFDVSGVIRPYDPNGIWLGSFEPRKGLPAVITGGILQEVNHVNDFGEHQVKFPLVFNLGETSPVISVREIQETVTSEGGAAHSVSGSSDTVLMTQDGLVSDLLITGSLIDNKRASHIGAESYREAGVQMKGGLKMHMRRSDGEDSYSEMGTSLKDSQGNAAHLILGANSQTLSELGDRAHGIIQQSTGYAKRVAAGNDCDTVGDPDNPVTQKSLVKQGDQTAHSTQTNVASGTYNQTYYTEANGVKVDSAPVQAKTLQTNPAIKHYFYVVPQTTNVSALADQLYGAETTTAAKSLFAHINLMAYVNSIGAGTWAYIPMATQTYKADDEVAVHNGLSQIQSQVDNQNKDSLDAYGLWHQVFGWNYENTLVLAGAYLKTNSTQINAQLAQISQRLNKIGQINKQDQLTGNVVNTALYQEQTRMLGEELHQDVNQLVHTFSIPDSGFASSFASDTGLNYNANILGFKADTLTEADLENLSKLKMQGLKMADAAKGIGYLTTGLDIVASGDNIYQTCQKYCDGSTLCHANAVGDTAQVGAGELFLGISSAATSEWLGCNAALDLETAGTGVLVCTIGVAAASIAASNVSGDVAKSTIEKGYQKAVIYSQHFEINKSE